MSLNADVLLLGKNISKIQFTKQINLTVIIYIEKESAVSEGSSSGFSVFVCHYELDRNEKNLKLRC